MPPSLVGEQPTSVYRRRSRRQEARDQEARLDTCLRTPLASLSIALSRGTDARWEVLSQQLVVQHTKDNGINAQIGGIIEKSSKTKGRGSTSRVTEPHRRGRTEIGEGVRTHPNPDLYSSDDFLGAPAEVFSPAELLHKPFRTQSVVWFSRGTCFLADISRLGKL